ncbi:hypothetical protein [Massilia sp. 9096]|uniref:hypothetical protein n=1 Tax=Massilia sp. 9096 TaxID=1500894 RepID=UPI000561D2C8|nr:hypothetical protein [Massilia sp. 9096]
MPTSNTKPDTASNGAGMQHEADVGSGERSPGQQETDQMIKEIPPVGNLQEGQPGSQQSEGGAKP